MTYDVTSHLNEVTQIMDFNVLLQHACADYFVHLSTHHSRFVITIFFKVLQLRVRTVRILFATYHLGRHVNAQQFRSQVCEEICKR